MATPSRREFLKQSAACLGSSLALGRATWGLEAGEVDEAFKPRFSFCNETFAGWSFEKACEATAKAGYQGIEIAPFTLARSVTDIDAARRRRLRGDAEKAGLEVVALHWLLAKTKGLHLTSPDRDVRSNTADYLIALARFCADLGGKRLVFGSPKQRNRLPGVSEEDAFRYAREVIEKTLPTLEKTGVVLAMEPLAPKTTNFLRTAAEAVRLVEMVDSESCRLILDCLAMSTETRPIPALIEKYRTRLVHFHANDPNGRGPGFGKLDFTPIFQALRKARYAGWVSVEVFDYSPGAERLARESLQYMRKCL